MRTYNLDELLTDTGSRIALSNITEEYLPETFEEWCRIHGEPEYLNEKTKTSPLEISIVDCETYPVQVDTSDIITEDKKGNLQLDYKRFVDAFAETNRLVYCHGMFYTPDGAVSSQSVRRDIANTLGDMGWKSRLDVPTNSLFISLKDMYQTDELEVDENVIPVSNGDLHIKKNQWEFRLGEKKQAPYRLSVRYTPVSRPTPLFDKWLEDVFAPEDIPVIQEIMGYCLVPLTSAQEAFFLVGDAGVGKSGFGTILKSIMGNAFESINTQELVSQRFQIATVENKLVAYDDDLGSAALEETGLLKKLITADAPIPAERKYGDPYSFMPYCRIVASANFMLSSLYDDSDGFYRRLHPILVKSKNPNRKNINKFYEMIIEQEKEQVFRWALIGLKRVIENGWQISWSQRSIDYMGVTKSQGTHFEDFFKETCTIDKNGSISSAELKKLYLRWCRENGIKDASDRRLFRWFSDNAESIGAVFTTHLPRGQRRVRGYKGIQVNSEWNESVLIYENKRTS